MSRRAARPSTVFQLNQMAGKSKITPAAKRRSNERECSFGEGFVGVPTFFAMVITSIKPVPTSEEFNCESLRECSWLCRESSAPGDRTRFTKNGSRACSRVGRI